jgi:hypothetical protein
MEYVIHIFRIQNMKVVDGVPEYKNGFVSFSSFSKDFSCGNCVS